MDIPSLGQDRFLKKDPNQSDQTKGAAYTVINPKPKIGQDNSSKIGQPNKSQEDGGAPNVLTGTVITSCFIQTSALPSRVEMQGNDITFFDDTYAKDGKVVGDTSRIVFTHASAKDGEVIESGFILQKRALSTNTYTNVLELFSPDNSPNTNFVFIGRMGTGAERNISLIEIDADYRTITGDSAGYINGVFRVRTSRDGIDNNYRDGLYVMDRGTESASRNGSVEWLVAAGEGGQVRLSYMANRDDNPLTDALYDIYISSAGISLFGIPTSAPASANAIWNNNGVLNIGPGGSGTVKSYGGYVDPNATGASLPSGWSVSKSGGNVYTVTHNLGTTGYTVIPTAIDSNSLTYFHPFVAFHANDFTVEFDNSGGTAGATDWTFALIMI